MAGIAGGAVGTFKSALSIPVVVSVTTGATTVSVSAITKDEMQSVMDTADVETIEALGKVQRALDSIKLGMQIATEEELDVAEESS